MRKIGIFRQEAVAWMDRVNSGLHSDFNDPLPVEIGRDRPRALAQMIRLIRLETMQRELVLFGIDRNSAYPEFIRRAKNTNRNLAAVGDEQFVDA